jgi:hypothetical protein
VESVTSGFAAAQVQIERDSKELGMAVQTSAQDTRNISLNGFNQARTDLFQGFALASTERVKFAGDVALTACQSTASLQLTAAANASATLAAIAACCCETKELIRAEAGVTRDLVNSIQKDNVQAALTAALAEINLLKVSSTLRTGNS